MRPEDSFNFRVPDYTEILHARIQRLQHLRANLKELPALREYYKWHPWDFVADWGVTADPRNLERGIPVLTPFVLFPKQREWMEWTFEKWRTQSPGLTEKSRDCGISWCAMAFSCTLCLFWDQMQIGFGSRKEVYVDAPVPKSLLYKGRQFMQHLPLELRGGWDLKKHAPYMRIEFPESGSIISGEAGDNIGRGDRQSIYFVDEAAYLERPLLVDASLSATTNCRQDVSSVNGMANPFAEKRHANKIPVFVFDWRDDPRKTDAWYAKQCEILDPVIVAAEIDRDYLASIEGQIIPAAWVSSAIDAHVKLSIKPTGAKRASFDVADRGKDKCAMAFRHGFLLQDVLQWSGSESDIYASTERAFMEVDTHPGYGGLEYDADGLGASVRGDARKINQARKSTGAKALRILDFRGSGAVQDPESIVPRTDRTAEDFFENFKAQSWWDLRFRFEATHNAVTKGLPIKPDDLISIPGTLKELTRLRSELSQPQWKLSKNGKVMVEKMPDGALSPNLADSVMIAYSRRSDMLIIPDSVLEAT